MQHDASHARANGHAPSEASTEPWLPDAHQVRLVYRYLYRHVGNREEAEELTERTCIRALHVAWQDTSTASNRQLMEVRLVEIARAVVEEHLHWFYGYTAQLPLEGPLGQHEEASSPKPGITAACPTESTDSLLARLPASERDVLTRRFLRAASLADTAAQMRLSSAEVLALQWLALQHAAKFVACLPTGTLQYSPTMPGHKPVTGRAG